MNTPLYKSKKKSINYKKDSLQKFYERTLDSAIAILAQKFSKIAARGKVNLITPRTC